MRIWPRSMRGQLLLAIAFALFIAQGLSALLLYRAQVERREGVLVNAAAFRLADAVRGRSAGREPPGPPGLRMQVQSSDTAPQLEGERRLPSAESGLREVLEREGVAIDEAVVVVRPIGSDRLARQWLERAALRRFDRNRPPPRDLMVAGVRLPNGAWLSARIPVPAGERRLLATMIAQTLFTYLVLVGAVALVLRRITRPLAMLATRMERFAGNRDGSPPLAPQGPADVRHLIAAHNALEARISALLDEKDVMLGAIGHDLKTPLAVLRVRIENVENEAERMRMAQTIDDIARSLDDILSLARVGRPSDLPEPTELGALTASVVEEYEDRGEPVTLAHAPRMVLAVRASWLRRAMRNLIDNAVRYGSEARVSLERDAARISIHIDDSGPGIPQDQLARMLEPFTRIETSRNSATGGSGLGLTLARAVAEQHGGSLILANRPDKGLRASISLPAD